MGHPFVRKCSPFHRPPFCEENTVLFTGRRFVRKTRFFSWATVSGICSKNGVTTLHVLSQVVCSLKPFLALAASVGRLARVDPHVLFQLASLHKAPRAHLAVERPFAPVVPDDVAFQAVLAAKLPAALLARERVLARVDPHVDGEGLSLQETGAADLAGEPLARVVLPVQLEVVVVAEAPVAVLALERTLPGVALPTVVLQGLLRRELRPARFAREPLAVHAHVALHVASQAEVAGQFGATDIARTPNLLLHFLLLGRQPLT